MIQGDLGAQGNTGVALATAAAACVVGMGSALFYAKRKLDLKELEQKEALRD